MKPAKQSAAKVSSPRSPRLFFKPFCSSPSFDDGSTLPSAIHSGFSTTRQLLASPRSKTVSKTDLRPLKDELLDLECLQSVLLQWQYANALAERTETLCTRRTEEEVFDRGMQIADLQEEVLREISKLQEREQMRLLSDVLETEINALEPATDTIAKMGEFLQQLQQCTKSALNRVTLQGDCGSLLESLTAARHSLDRMHGFLADEETDTLALSEPSRRLAEVVEEERGEVTNSYVLLTEVRKLYELEKEFLAPDGDPV